jgi:hypothetical protein
MKTNLCLFWVLALSSPACHLNRSTFAKRPSEDIDVVLTSVSIDPQIPQDHWIRQYDVFASRIPWSNSNSNYLPLHFIPRGAHSHRTLDREDYLEFSGVLGDTIKPFCPTQSSFDSGLPFVIYLDYISSDLTGKAPVHAEIHLPQRYKK